MSLSGQLTDVLNQLSSLSIGLVISILLLLIAYIDMKNSVTSSRRDKEDYIDSRLKLDFLIQTRSGKDELHCKRRKVWVNENNRWWYIFTRYAPFIGGFSGTTTVQIASNDMDKVDQIHFLRHLSRFPVSSHVTDVEFNVNSVTLEFDTVDAEEVENQFSKIISVLSSSINSPLGSPDESGLHRPILLDINKPPGWTNKLLSVFVMRRIKQICDDDEMIFRSSNTRKIGDNHFSMRVYSSNDGAEKVSTSAEELMSTTGMLEFLLPFRDSGYREAFNQDSEVIELVEQLEMIDQDLLRQEAEEREYSGRSETYTVLPFDLVPSRDIGKLGKHIGTISLDRSSKIFAGKIGEEEPEVEIGERYELEIPIRNFVPSEFEDEIEFRERLRQGIDKEKFSNRFLRKHSDAVAVTFKDYTFESYYELEDGKYFSVRWFPNGEHRIWSYGQRNPDFPIRKHGITVWESTEN